MQILDDLDERVQREAEALTPELLPRLLKILLQPGRTGLVYCDRHRFLLIPYVRAQIDLARTKRSFERFHGNGHVAPSALDSAEKTLVICRAKRDEARKLYRSTPCTCWVPHR